MTRSWASGFGDGISPVLLGTALYKSCCGLASLGEVRRCQGRRGALAGIEPFYAGFGVFVIIDRIIRIDLGGFVGGAIEGGKRPVTAFHMHVQRDAGKASKVAKAFCSVECVRGRFRLSICSPVCFN